MAGSAMILPECRWMWDGVEGADSLVVNPHKWLGAAFDCSLYYVRDPEHLVRVMSTNPSYLQIGRRRPGEELPRLGHPARPPLPRAEALVPDPRAGRVAACRRGCGATSRTRAGSPTQVARRRRTGACSRRCRCRRSACGTSRRDSSGDALDRHTQAWGERVNRSGAAYLTPAVLDGRWMVRVSIGAEQTERAHVEALWTHDATRRRNDDDRQRRIPTRRSPRASATSPRGLANTHPIFVARAEGTRVWDVDGTEYLDFTSGIGVLNTGHRHPRVVARGAASSSIA